MPNIKTTPRWRCPVCKQRFESEKDLEDHAPGCLKRKASEEEYQCDDCDYGTSRRSDFLRHKRRRHSKSTSIVEDTDMDSEWERQNPGNLSDVIGDSVKPTTAPSTTVSDSLLLGRAIRKMTSPEPLSSHKKKLLNTLKSSVIPQRVSSIRPLNLPRLPVPRTTAALGAPAISTQPTTLRIVTRRESDSEDSNLSSPRPWVYSAPMSTQCTVVQATTTSPTEMQAVAPAGLQLVEKKIVKRYYRDGVSYEETEVWKK